MTTGYLPTFQIFANGENVTARFQDRALSINVELAAGNGAQDSVEITLDDREYLIATPRVKDRIEVYLGYEDIGTTFMGSFEINSVRFSLPPRQISVRGTAASSLNRIKEQQVKEFSDKTIEQILAEGASIAGLKVKVHPSLADIKIPFLNNSQSFGSLVNRIESQYSAVAKYTSDGLALFPRGEGRSVSDIALPTYVFTEEHFADLEVLTDSRGETAKTSASYMDKNTNQRVYVESKSKISNLDTEAGHIIGFMYNSKEEAQAAADSVQATLDRSTGKIAATMAEGDPWIRDGQRIVITGIRDGVNGAYLIDIVQHVYTKNGALKTSFTGTAGINGLAAQYQSEGSGDNFYVPLPGQIIGETIPTLPKSSGAVPAFVEAQELFPLTPEPSIYVPRSGGFPAPSRPSDFDVQ